MQEGHHDSLRRLITTLFLAVSGFVQASTRFVAIPVRAHERLTDVGHPDFRCVARMTTSWSMRHFDQPRLTTLWRKVVTSRFASMRVIIHTSVHSSSTSSSNVVVLTYPTSEFRRLRDLSDSSQPVTFTSRNLPKARQGLRKSDSSYSEKILYLEGRLEEVCRSLGMLVVDQLLR